MRRRLIANVLFFILTSVTVAQPYCEVHNYTIRDGLAAGVVSSFAQTDNDLMWFATWNGICCYDGYRFATFRNQPGVSEVLTTNRIFVIKPSVTGDIWCCTYDRHIYLFDTHSSRFIDVGAIIKGKFGSDVTVRNIYTLPNGYTWLVSNNSGPNYRIDDRKIKQGEGVEMYSVSNKTLRSNSVRKVESDEADREWIFDDKGILQNGGRISSNVFFEHMGCLGNNTFFASNTGAVSVCPPDAAKLRTIAMPSGVTAINNMLPLDSLHMLFATNAGIVSYDLSTNTTRSYSVKTPLQLSENVIELFVDAKKRIWAFTSSDGIVMIDSRTAEVQWLMAKADNIIRQTTSDIPFVHEDRFGTIWTVPTGGTFSYYDEARRTLVPYVLTARSIHSTYLPTITKFGIDHAKNMWFTGTRDLNLINFKYHHFKFTPVLPNQDVRSLLVDSKGRTWAGTYNGELAVFGPDGRLQGFMNNKGKIQSEMVVFSNRIYSLREDSLHCMWIGTKGSGLYIIAPDGTIKHFTYNSSDTYSLSHDEVYDIDIDSKGRVWLATFGGGLNLVDVTEGNIRFINHRNLMKQYPQKQFNKARRITHDSNGAILLSTNSGLLTFSDDFKTPADITFYSSRHQLGDTTTIMANDVLQTLVTSDGKVLVATLGGGVQQMTSASPLQNNLQFCRLANVRPDESIVQSITEDNNGFIWIVRESSIEQYNPATGSLSKYGLNNIGYDLEMSEAKPVHNRQTDAISVGVWGGFLSFVPSELKKSDNSPNIVFTGVLYQGENALEPILNKKTLEVSADNRNLTIYFAALEYTDKYLVQYAYKLDGVDSRWNYVGSANSASFNYLPAGNYKLLVKSTNSDGVWMDNVTELDICVHPTFWETGWAKLLYFLLICGLVWLAIYIYNLQSRARMERELGEMKIKFFTEIGHKLRTPLTLIGGPVTEVLDHSVLNDTARRHLEMVQRNASHMLELVNKMLHYSMGDGRRRKMEAVTIDDVTVEQPVKRTEDEITAENRPEQADNALVLHSADAVVQPAAGKERLLVVEDNDDLRDFLVTILQDEYTVLQAENGSRGLEIAKSEMPDFIITDIMMPVMDGLTMVRNIKQSSDICHIPIIVLSAKASLEDRLQGLKEGIDDYITKPFSAIYLKSRVRNIIRQRHILQQAFVEQIKPDDKKTYKLDAPQIVDVDSEMMKQLLNYLEEHIGDPSLKIEDLADAVNLGRSVFYGKIKSIVGMTPVDFVRHIRMQRAEELISKSNYPFSQIAYMVGFSDPKYFSKCFKRETGLTPSEYRDKSES